MKKNLILKALYVARDLRLPALFSSLDQHLSGRVLDVGGWDFFKKYEGRTGYSIWVTIDPFNYIQLKTSDPRVCISAADGAQLPFASGSFDTVLCIQVLEHVFEPLKVFGELCRVLRPNGTLIVVVPQTANLHLAPHHYQNFTFFWLKRAAEEQHLSILQLEPQGGFWSSASSRFFAFFFQSFRFSGSTLSFLKRPMLFFLLWPLMALYASISVVICLIFSLGDLEEEPNNILLVASRREAQS